MVAAVIPVKKLSDAKARMKGFLTASERKHLCMAMLCDVLEAIGKTSEISGIHVVTSDPEVRRSLEYSNPDVTIIREPGRSDLNRAIRCSSCYLLNHGVRGMLVVPGDLPLIESSVLGDCVRLSEGAPVTIAPDRSGDGTSLLLLRAPDVISPRFGPGSFQAHVKAARSAGCLFSVYTGGRATWDIDHPRDLDVLVRYGRGTKTRAEMCSLGIDERLARFYAGATNIARGASDVPKREDRRRGELP